MRDPDPSLMYKKLRSRFGFLHWWPGDTEFEIFVGAILTQQTSWGNVEKAIANLKAARCLNLEKISSLSTSTLESLIKPSGFYRQKARRLGDICKSIKQDYGSLQALFRLDKDELRKVLLSYNGIGNETADSIILYAAEKPIFVIDAYTKRAMNRIDPNISKEIGYGQLQGYFEDRMTPDLKLYKDMHAQFVELGKHYCKVKPVCKDCPLNDMCEYGSQVIP
jgi:endonuclease-3 related protein